MTTVLAIVVGGLFAAGICTMLRRDAVMLIVGLALLGHATNLLIFTAAGPVRESPPLVRADVADQPGRLADPLPQAFILTAIVIGFGIQAFALILVRRASQIVGTEDVDEMRDEDR
jgi:multicomponent Na+:H+ antiporter subunit C